MRSSQSRSLSRSVRRLAHRQPVPTSFRERVAWFLERWRRLPVALLCSLAIVAALLGFHRYLVHSDYFQVVEIVYTGNERLGEGALANYLLREVGLEEGVSALQVKTARIEAKLRLLPEVESVSSHIMWPDRVAIDIRERAAAGILVTGTGSHVFDPSGFLFAEAAPADFADPRLPVLTGFESLETAVGALIPAGPLSEIRSYDAVFRLSNPTLHGRIAEYHWSDGIGLTLVFEGGERFACGRRPPEKTGPVIERLMEATPEDESIRVASLFSDLYATIERGPAPRAWPPQPLLLPEGGMN